MTSAGSIRIGSRRAQLLIQRYKQQQGEVGGKQKSVSTPKSTPKPEETPWPPSIRYTFYTVCAASVPFAIGQALASSPKLRELLFGDDDEAGNTVNFEEGRLRTTSVDADGAWMSSKNILSWVRSYWGHEDYVPPIDRLPLYHTTPGFRHAWQEDNLSSLLQMFGLCNRMVAPTDQEKVNIVRPKESPMSLDNEPPFHTRYDQSVLSQYLSTRTNPIGVKTRLTLFPCATSSSSGTTTSDDELHGLAGYDTICTLPANITVSTLRLACKGSDAQAIKRDLAEKSDVTFLSKSISERIRTYCWREDCRWVVTFPDDNDDDDYSASENDTHIQFPSQERSSLRKTSNVLRHSTAIYSSWTYFPEFSGGSAPTTAVLTPSLGSSSSSTLTGHTSNTTKPSSLSVESLRVQKLQYVISELERELKDPSSMRDRDSMYEELRQAKSELRNLRPWWRRLW